MKFNHGVGFLLFVAGTFADMDAKLPGDYTFWKNKCAGKCDPIDGGMDGTPRTCSPAFGCAPPQEDHALCVTKDYDEGLGGCTSENS
ncbi:hypothetical protein BJX96DRAFT_169306 [Aspergillus floccosus]